MVDNPLLRDLTLEQYDLLSPLFDRIGFASRTIICRQGRPAEHLYFLLEGKVSLRYKPYDGPRITLTHLHAGDVFGWSSVVGNVTYTSDAISTTQVTVLRVQGDALRDLCMKHPATGTQILEKLAVAVAPRWVHSRTQIQSILRQHVLARS